MGGYEEVLLAGKLIYCFDHTHVCLDNDSSFLIPWQPAVSFCITATQLFLPRGPFHGSNGRNLGYFSQLWDRNLGYFSHVHSL